jgi:hypothetical protein
MNPDFSGYATKANLRCSDGRTIMPDAFKHMDGEKVPLVWQHTHNDPTNVLGHMVLEARDGDMYGYAFFNETEQAKGTKLLVEHGDITALSIYANKLMEKDKHVMHGQIREVSLVLSGANPGAMIDNVNIAHGDGSIGMVDDEAVIYTGLPLTLTHSEESNMSVNTDSNDSTVQDIYETLNEDQRDVVEFLLGEALAHAEGDDDKGDDKGDDERTVQEIFDGMSEDEKNVVYFMIGEALEAAAKKASDGKSTDSKPSDSDDNSAKHSDSLLEGNTMTHNVFERDMSGTDNSKALSHADAALIFDDAKKVHSLKEAVEGYALKHGIQDIDILFPDAKAVTATPEFLARRSEWVSEVMSGTRHTPFARIKSLTANLTLDEARAKGYVKGNLKEEEFFRVSKRTTTPQTIYKKQKLDRDDVLDITDFDVVAWLKGEMRIMLDEEIARAVLIGDGRSIGNPDKIQEDHVRPIATDSDLYVTYLNVNLGDANSSAEEIIDAVTLNRRHYRGSGNPVFYTSETILAKLLLIKDSLGRRIYSTVNDLAAALRVSKIVAVEVMDEPSVDIVGIVVNLSDYTIGADKGGDVSLFDDFDIDYNQYKYLLETRLSGALIKPKSALVIKSVAEAAVAVKPVAPSWNNTNKSVTVATTAGLIYKNKLTNATLVTATPIVLGEDDELSVIAVPSGTGYYVESTGADEWLFTYKGQASGAF